MHRIFSFFCLSALLIPSFGAALYNGNPSLPSMPEDGIFLSKDSFISVKTGYEGDFLFGRGLSVSSGVSSPSIRSMFNGASLSIGFINQIELYTVLGAVETKLSVDALDSHIKLQTGQNFGGEVGIRANTSVWGDMKFGVDGKYFYAWPTLSSLSGNVFQKEWQIGASLSQSFAFLIPYAGVKFSKFQMEFVDLADLQEWIPSQRVDIHNKSPFGCFVGLGIAGEKGPYFNFEARFLDEYSITGTLGLSF